MRAGSPGRDGADLGVGAEIEGVQQRGECVATGGVLLIEKSAHGEQDSQRGAVIVPRGAGTRDSSRYGAWRFGVRVRWVRRGVALLVVRFVVAAALLLVVLHPGTAQQWRIFAGTVGMVVLLVRDH